MRWLTIFNTVVIFGLCLVALGQNYEIRQILKILRDLGSYVYGIPK